MKIKLLIRGILISFLFLLALHCTDESPRLIAPWQGFAAIIRQGKLLEMADDKLTVEYNDPYNKSPKQLLVEYTRLAQNDGWEQAPKTEKTISAFAAQFKKKNLILIVEIQYGRGTLWAKLKINK